MKVNVDEINKILLIQYQPYGDVLLNTAYIPYLREKFPTAKIDYLVRKPYDAVLRKNDFLDELVTFETYNGLLDIYYRIKLFFEIRKKKYDLVIDQMMGTGSAQFVMFSGARYKLGYEGKWWDFVYNIKGRKGAKRYYASMKFDLLKPLGINDESNKLYFHISQDAQSYIDNWLVENNLNDKILIAVAPGSPVEKKKWAAENYAKLSDKIIQSKGYEIIFMMAPKEITDVRKVQDLMDEEAILSPKTTFEQAAALLKRVKLLICNDGGLNHLSIAVETPSLSIFGRTNPVKWSGHEIKNHFCLSHPERRKINDNTFGISAETAFDKFNEIIGKIST